MTSLSRLPQEPPVIPPFSDEGSGYFRPLWSVMIPAYNCAQYLTETLESVLQQDPGELKMQIEVCDDASADADIKQLVADIGKGRIAYFRQPENVG
ncbi:MAG: glycosyltransferase, partial [Chitinophagaceae bacterium]